MNDVELLEQHRRGSDEAFAELVRRHIGWVYGVARRRLHDAHLAEDVAQTVFVLLHRKAPKFPADAAMMRWLHKAAWYSTEVALRNQRRRQRRETEAAMMQPVLTEPAQQSEWEQLAPVLDRLIRKLSRADREAILLRYYRDMTFADVAAQIGTSADAARKRIERAIEKLRDAAAETGLTMSVATLAMNLAQEVRIAPPPALVASAASATAAAATAPILKGAMIMMTVTNAKFLTVGAVAGLLLGGGATWVLTASPSAQKASEAKLLYADTEAKFVVTERPFTTGGDYPKLAPYPAIRWRDTTPEVQLDETWYELVALNDQPTAKIVQAAQKLDARVWQKRFEEDLVEVMARMGSQPGDKVKLQLRTLDTKQLITRDNVPMTRENRQKIWDARQQKENEVKFETRDL